MGWGEYCHSCGKGAGDDLRHDWLGSPFFDLNENGVGRIAGGSVQRLYEVIVTIRHQGFVPQSPISD